MTITQSLASSDPRARPRGQLLLRVLEVPQGDGGPVRRSPLQKPGVILEREVVAVGADLRAPVEHELQAIAGLQPECHSIVAVVAEAGCVPLDVLADLLVGGQDGSAQVEDAVLHRVGEPIQELIDLRRLGFHSVFLAGEATGRVGHCAIQCSSRVAAGADVRSRRWTSGELRVRGGETA
jgi:hypothetical protein